MFDIEEVEALLRGAARAGHSLTYSESLLALGWRFTRPKMRALCKILDEVDRRAEAAGEPELAVLVVRESDGLPGQGWWVNRQGSGAWTGPTAAVLVQDLQQRAFAHWRGR